MPDLHYDHPRLAALYDIDSGWSADHDFFLSLPGTGRKRILDFGCGTGLICGAYAASGHEVTGVDPSNAMLDVARRRPQPAGIAWIHCRAQDFRSEKRFDLVIMTGHAFQVLLTDRDIRATFAVMRQHLANDGLIVFESRNPAIDWQARWDGGCFDFEIDGAAVRQTRHVLSIGNQRMLFETRYAFADEVLVPSSELLFLSLDEIGSRIAGSGLRLEKVVGDWNGAAFDPLHSDEMIFFVRHP
jgi:SAM-dependent methyltransferase